MVSEALLHHEGSFYNRSMLQTSCKCLQHDGWDTWTNGTMQKHEEEKLRVLYRIPSAWVSLFTQSPINTSCLYKWGSCGRCWKDSSSTQWDFREGAPCWPARPCSNEVTSLSSSKNTNMCFHTECIKSHWCISSHFSFNPNLAPELFFCLFFYAFLRIAWADNLD